MPQSGSLESRQDPTTTTYFPAGGGELLPKYEAGASKSSKVAAAEAYAHSRSNFIFVVIVCVAWMAVSSGAIMINRALMVNLGFRYPVTVAWLGLLTSTALAVIYVHLLVPPHQRHNITRDDYMRRVVPVGFFMALTFQTGNTGYLYLTVAFVQMLKALCPVVTMLLLFVVKLEVATRRLVASVVVISVGIALASFGEMHMNAVGLAAMLTSVVSESVRLVMTQHLLIGKSFHPMEGLKYIGSACTVWLFIQAVFWEWGHIWSSKAYLIAFRHPLMFLVAACAGFGVNALAILVIKLASSLTLKVLGSVKDTLLVTVGVVYLHEAVSPLQLCGYLISLCGFVSYNQVKSQTGAPAPHHGKGGTEPLGVVKIIKVLGSASPILSHHGVASKNSV